MCVCVWRWEWNLDLRHARQAFYSQTISPALKAFLKDRFPLTLVPTSEEYGDS